MKNKYISHWISLTAWMAGLIIILVLFVKGPIDIFIAGTYNYRAYFVGIFQGMVGSAGFFGLVELVLYALDRRRIKK